MYHYFCLFSVHQQFFITSSKEFKIVYIFAQKIFDQIASIQWWQISPLNQALQNCKILKEEFDFVMDLSVCAEAKNNSINESSEIYKINAVDVTKFM